MPGPMLTLPDGSLLPRLDDLRFSVLSSGSSGNSTYVESKDPGAPGILIDAGLSCKRLGRLLKSVGRTLGDVGAVLLTHGHSDHTSGARSLVRETGVPVVAAPGVGEKLGARLLAPGEVFEVGGLRASFFAVPHDAPTYGVRVSGMGGESLALATDFGEMRDEMLRGLLGVGAVVLEANHDSEWLASGPYPAHLKRRIASASGHLSNDQTAAAAVALAARGLKDVVLAHLSETNNTPARACGTVRSALRGAGFGEVRVRAALARRPTPWIEVGEEVVPATEESGPRAFEPEEYTGRLFEGGVSGL